MNKKGNTGLIIILIVALILIVMFVVLYIYSKPASNVEQNLTVNKTYYDIYIHSNALTEISYVLSNGSVTLVQGTLHDPSIIEQFKGIEKNSTVFLYGWSDEYYYNITNCTVEVNNSHCVLGLDRKALEYYIKVTPDVVSVLSVNGKIQDSYLCFSWFTNVADILTDLPSVPVPQEYKYFIDKCYDMGNVTSNYFVPIQVHMNPFYHTAMPFNVYIFDHEKGGYKSIGMRNATLVI